MRVCSQLRLGLGRAVLVGTLPQYFSWSSAVRMRYFGVPGDFTNKKSLE